MPPEEHLQKVASELGYAGRRLRQRIGLRSLDNSLASKTIIALSLENYRPSVVIVSFHVAQAERRCRTLPRQYGSRCTHIHECSLDPVLQPSKARDRTCIWRSA